jgi:hypothetical protein
LREVASLPDFKETIMHESRAAGFGVKFAFTRMFGVLDAASTSVAGFALLAGTRAFAFTALLAWREPVLGGAGLVLLGLVGWLRWCCSKRNGAGASPAGQHCVNADAV